MRTNEQQDNIDRARRAVVDALIAHLLCDERGTYRTFEGALNVHLGQLNLAGASIDTISDECDRIHQDALFAASEGGAS